MSACAATNQEPVFDRTARVGKRKSVLIIYTGGTMGMKKGPDGSLSPVPGYLTEQIKYNFSEMQREEMPIFDIIEYDKLLDSSCMGCEDWVKIVTDIEDNYSKYSGFVVLMGTDTMAYTSSACSFMLENLSKPVIFTGAQVPFCEVYSDARRNLLGGELHNDSYLCVTIYPTVLLFESAQIMVCHCAQDAKHSVRCIIVIFSHLCLPEFYFGCSYDICCQTDVLRSVHLLR